MIPSVVFNLDLVDVNCSSQYEVMPSLGHKNKSVIVLKRPKRLHVSAKADANYLLG